MSPEIEQRLARLEAQGARLEALSVAHLCNLMLISACQIEPRTPEVLHHIEYMQAQVRRSSARLAQMASMDNWEGVPFVPLVH